MLMDTLFTGLWHEDRWIYKPAREMEKEDILFALDVVRENLKTAGEYSAEMWRSEALRLHLELNKRDRARIQRIRDRKNAHKSLIEGVMKTIEKRG